MRHLAQRKILVILFFTLTPLILFSQSAQIQSEQARQNESSSGLLKPTFETFKFLNNASSPSKFFFAPSSRILKSLEVSFTTGGFFGVEENGNLFNQIGIGLGNIAEVEFTSSNIANRLTGKTTTVPTSVFKVSLIPESLAEYWFIPQMAVQLRSSSWQPVAENNSQLKAENITFYNNVRLRYLNVTSRFTTLYGIVGKDFAFGGLHVGFSLSDIRTPNGRQWLYDASSVDYYDVVIPEMKKEILSPFGGIYIQANPQTQLMAEVEPIPLFGYDVKQRQVTIRRAWLGIAGVRFFITRWLTLDTGVKYQSDFDGIADSEINIGLNILVPFRSLNKME